MVLFENPSSVSGKVTVIETFPGKASVVSLQYSEKMISWE